MLTVTLNLNAPQREALAAAMKGNPINPFVTPTQVDLTADTVLAVREAVVQLFRKKFAQKSRTAQVVATCFACERVLDKIDNILDVFGYEAPDEALQESDGVAIVSIPSLTTGTIPIDATLVIDEVTPTFNEPLDEIVEISEELGLYDEQETDNEQTTP